MKITREKDGCVTSITSPYAGRTLADGFVALRSEMPNLKETVTADECEWMEFSDIGSSQAVPEPITPWAIGCFLTPLKSPARFKQTPFTVNLTVRLL